MTSGGRVRRPRPAPTVPLGSSPEACPKEISIDFIAMLNRDYRKARRVR
jgi:hypothetical protein